MARISQWIGLPLAAAGGYGLLCLIAHRSVFYPMKYPDGLWELQTEAGAEDVWLRTADGVKIHGWWVARPGAGLATLYLHGNAGNISHRAGHIREITAAGSSMLIIDYRGYGKSEGSPSERGLYADADAGYQNLLERGYPPERIVLHGESLGTVVAVDLASRRRAAAVILEAPFTSARDLAARVLPLVGPLVIWGYDSKAKIRNIHAPLLIIHGERDDIVPPELSRGLFGAAAEPKSLWIVPGAGHNDIVEAAGPAYGVRLREIYGRCTVRSH